MKKIKTLLQSIISFFDRKYNLIFHKQLLFRIYFDKTQYFKYNDIVTNGIQNFRYLNNNWYKLIQKKNEQKHIKEVISANADYVNNKTTSSESADKLVKAIDEYTETIINELELKTNVYVQGTRT